MSHSTFSIATGYGVDYQGVGVQVTVQLRIFTSPYSSDRLLGPPILLSNGYQRALSPGVKQQGRESDHSPPSSAEVKKTDQYIHAPICLHGIVLCQLSTRTTLLFFFTFLRRTALPSHELCI
jgi:hypothetical protein